MTSGRRPHESPSTPGGLRLYEQATARQMSREERRVMTDSTSTIEPMMKVQIGSLAPYYLI